MGDGPVTVRFNAGDGPAEIAKRIEAARAGHRWQDTPEPGKAAPAIDQLIRDHPNKKDSSKGWAERSPVTRSEARAGVTDAVVLHYPPSAGHSSGTQLRIGLDRDGQLVKIDPNAETAKLVDSYIKKNGVWHWKDKQGKLQRMSLQNYEFSPETGEFQSQDRPNHISVFKLDGSKSDINILPTGAKVRTDSKGSIEQVERSDSSVLVPKYKSDAGGNKTTELEGFTVLKPDSNKTLVPQVSYHREGNDFVPDEKFKDQPKLTGVALAKSGNLTYKHKEGATAGQEFTVWGNGTTLQTSGRATYKFDDLGRITSITPCAEDLAKGGVIRDGIKYRGDTDEIVAITAQCPKTQGDLKFHSTYDEHEKKWKMVDSAGRERPVGQQQVYFNHAGELAFKETVGQLGRKEEVEHVLHANGAETREKTVERSDGSQSTQFFDANGNLTGTRIEMDGKLVCSLSHKVVDGQPTITRTDSTSPRPTVFRQSLGSDGTWSTNEPLAPQLQSMTFDGDGVLTYKDKDNAWHRKLPDGSETVKYTDGTFARLDHEGRTTRVGIDNKHYLEYVRDDTGKLLQVNRVFPMQNSELWNAASRRPGEVLADGTFRHTDDEGRAILECRDLRSNLFEKAPSRDGVTPLLSQVTLPSGEKCAFEYGDDRDNQHPKRITFTHTERRRGQDGIVTRVLEALPTSGDVPDRANTPGQRVAPMQLYGMTSTIRFDQPPFDPFVAERRENIPNLYCALTVRPNGDVEATSYDRGAGRYVFHGNRIGNSNHVTKVTEGGERFLTAKRDFDRLFEREVATLLREAREDGRDLLSKDTKLEAKQRLARNLYLNHVTGQLRPLLADLEDSRMPARGLPKRDYHTKAKELEAARAILEERLRARREELGS